MTSIANEETALTDLMNLGQALLVPCKVIDRGILVITLYQFANEQKQLIVVPKNTSIPCHRHPNVWKMIEPVFGFARVGKMVGERFDKSVEIEAQMHGRYIIEKNQPHWLITDDYNFAFMSYQRWSEGAEIKSIEEDWIGEKL